MARTIAEIKKIMTDNYISDPTVITKYDLDENKTFEEQFSVTTIESLFFFIAASAIWSLEKLFDLHKADVEKTLSDKKPHRLKWYRDKTLDFQKGYTLPIDSDVYETIDETAKVVKYAAAVEPADSSRLLIKIAGGDQSRDRLPDDVAIQVYNYLQWIKDAGVRIELVNQSPDYFRCEYDIYFNAMLNPADVANAVREAISNYIENLPFNGEFSNMTLTDILQQIDGVIIPELIASSSKSSLDGYEYSFINAKRIPDAGYFRIYNSQDIILNMKAYELVHD